MPAKLFPEPKADDCGLAICSECNKPSDHLTYDETYQEYMCPACRFEAIRVAALEATTENAVCICETDKANCIFHSTDTAYGRAWRACFLTPEERKAVERATSVAEVAVMLGRGTSEKGGVGVKVAA